MWEIHKYIKEYILTSVEHMHLSPLLLNPTKMTKSGE